MLTTLTLAEIKLYQAIQNNPFTSLYSMQINMSSPKLLTMLAILLTITPFSYGFFNFNQQQHNQQQQNAKVSFEERFLNDKCSGYLCPDSEACVSTPNDCPCPFPSSQIRCSLPDGKHICISKPASHNPGINDIYDNSNTHDGISNEGVRDCGWVLKMATGKS